MTFQRLRVQLDNYFFDIDTISDTFGNTIARNNIPFAKGSYLSYMGEKAREIQFNAIFNRNKYQEHFSFLDYVRSGLVYQMVHPVYGLINGRIENPYVTHDNKIDYCAIRITFIEQLLGDEVQKVINLIPEIETQFIQGQDAEILALSEQMPVEKDALTKVIDKTQSLFSQFAEFGSVTRSIVAQVDTYISYIDSFYEGVLIPVESVLNLAEYASNLPSYITQSTTNAVARCAEAYYKITETPSLFLQSFTNAIDALKESTKLFFDDAITLEAVENNIDISTAQYASSLVSQYYQIDEDKRDIYENEVNKEYFDNLGNLIAIPTDINLLNQNELENSLAYIREMIDVSMNLNRDNLAQSHKQMALILEKHVNEIKLQRDKIIQIDVGQEPVPLHLICRNRDLPLAYDSKIMAINEIRNPFFITGLVNIYEVSNG